MKVGIDATNWSNSRGYGRYARGLLTALLAEPDGHDYLLFIDKLTRTNSPWPLPANANLVVVETKTAPTEAASASGRRSIGDMWAMATAVARFPLDVFYFPSVYTYFPLRTKAKVLVGIHDTIAESFPKLVFPNKKQRSFWNLKTWLARRQADFIVTVSEHARKRIIDQFHWPANRTWVVGEAPAPVFRPVTNTNSLLAALSPYGLTEESRFFICLGGLNPHKNLEMLFHVLAKMRQQPQFSDIHLVLVGPAESDLFTPGAGQARSTIQRLHLEEAVHLTGYIPDEEVACLLNAALALLMPSLDEGFGLGAVEAAACGTPVVATTSSPLPQLLAGGGIFTHPRQPSAWEDALAQILSDDPARNHMGRIALEQARLLSWPRAANQFRDLLARLSKSGLSQDDGFNLGVEIQKE